MKREQHPMAGKTVILNSKSDTCPNGLKINGEKYRIEDWWINVTGGVSWMDANGNPAALMFAIRSARADLPTDDEVVYGKIGNFGHIIHTSELGEVVTDL